MPSRVGSTYSHCLNEVEVYGRFNAGGICGSDESSYYVGCVNKGSITNRGDSCGAGGIVGDGSDLDMQDCTNSGTVDGWYGRWWYDRYRVV